MRVLVTGASGYVGRALVPKLIAAGDEVRCLSRQATRRRSGLPAAVGIVDADVTDPHAVEQALGGREAVIHLVGIIRERGGQTFERLHAEGTRTVVAAARRAGVRKIVHMSALGVRPNAVARYHRSKWEGEEAVRASGVPYVIFRPSIIAGPQDEFVNTFARLARLPGALTRTMPIVGSGRGKLQPIDVEEVTACFARAVRDDSIVNRVYELGGPEALTLEEIIDTILRVLRVRRLKVHLPLPVARIMASLFERVLPNPPFTRDQLIMLQEDNICDVQPMVRDFGFQPKRFEELIRGWLN